jgi:nitrogen fixation NifU-like protein
MQYSQKVMDHFSNPRNVGTLDEEDSAVGTGTIGSPVCGDVMRIQMKIDEVGVIEDVKFTTFGCGSAIASASYATELLKGKTIEEALEIRNVAIAEELELPAAKVHCSVLAEDAIRSAVEDYLKKQGKSLDGAGAGAGRDSAEP